LKVVGRDALAMLRPSLVVVLAWRYADPIAAKNGEYIRSGGRFLVPFPAVRVVAEECVEGGGRRGPT
jgi:hypothetical protein